MRRAKVAMVWVSVAFVTVFIGSTFNSVAALDIVPRTAVFLGGGSISVAWVDRQAFARFQLFHHFEQPRIRLVPRHFVIQIHGPATNCVVIPLIYPTIASLGAVWFMHRRERGLRYAAGACSKCGYDLRGGAGDVCPECGTAKELAG